eukprot:COSAG03_NODE_84_length_13698_cov_22.852857_8_plen_76_part_00
MNSDTRGNCAARRQEHTDDTDRCIETERLHRWEPNGRAGEEGNRRCRCGDQNCRPSVRERAPHPLDWVEILRHLL